MFLPYIFKGTKRFIFLLRYDREDDDTHDILVERLGFQKRSASPLLVAVAKGAARLDLSGQRLKIKTNDYNATALRVGRSRVVASKAGCGCT
jgi:hypothetical protein